LKGLTGVAPSALQARDPPLKALEQGPTISWKCQLASPYASTSDLIPLPINQLNGVKYG